MEYGQKSELVKALAESMGMQGTAQVQASNYDKATGTLYVGSMVYTPSQIEAARQFAEKQSKETKRFGDATSQMHEIAAIAIQMMQEGVLLSGGKIIVRRTEAQSEGEEG